MAHQTYAKSPARSSAALGFEVKLWLIAAREGGKTNRSVDLLGRIYGPASGSGGMPSHQSELLAA